MDDDDDDDCNIPLSWAVVESRSVKIVCENENAFGDGQHKYA